MFFFLIWTNFRSLYLSKIDIVDYAVPKKSVLSMSKLDNHTLMYFELLNSNPKAKSPDQFRFLRNLAFLVIFLKTTQGANLTFEKLLGSF